MYEPSRTIENFYIAGFQHYDGQLALADLKVGSKLALRAEPDNPEDASAVAVYYGERKLGYVPQSDNELIALLMFYGHADVFETLVMAVDPEAVPWNQVYAGVRVRDARPNSC